MEELDKQLAQLQLMNSRELSPKAMSKTIVPTAAVPTTIGLQKKIGPAVPPKPAKKALTLANVQRNDYTNMKMTLDNPAILEQKLEALEHHKRVLENQQKRRQQLAGGSGVGGSSGHSNVIAEINDSNTNYSSTKNQRASDTQHQQHDHQHESVNSTKIYENQSIRSKVGPSHNVSIMPIYSNFNNDRGKCAGIVSATNASGANVLAPVDLSDTGNYVIYSNIMSSGHQTAETMGARKSPATLISDGIGPGGYSNYIANYDGPHDLTSPPPPPPPPLPLSSAIDLPSSMGVDNQYTLHHSHHHHHHQEQQPQHHYQPHHNTMHVPEEELPPPPSPVSSSYSELRRATDTIYPSMSPSAGIIGAYAHTQQTYQQLNNNNNHNNTTISSNASKNINICGNSPGVSKSSTHNTEQFNGGIGNGSLSGNAIRPSTIVSAINTQDQQHGRHPTTFSLPTGHQSNSYSNSYHPLDYRTYIPGSQTSSSAYESIYEPINPRPPSEMSSRSIYSLYTPYGQSGAGSVSSSGIITGRGNGGIDQTTGEVSQVKLAASQKEAEVDALTDLLVRSMDNTDIDNYGICVQCGERVMDESSGCTAMEQIYHIACFTCCQCQINLQGKPFYALDGKPCCEEDYLNTLEKCSVCMKPILERILRATGKPYHPGCFCCVVCGKSLDGVPFTVDATNQNHCIEDFHRKFAPRCCVCRQPIMPEPGEEETVRVVALDRSFHVLCYKCEDCGLLLSSEAEGRGCFPLDDHILCKSCNAKRVQALTSHMSTEL